LVFRIKANAAITSTIVLNDIVMDSKLIPIGDNPKNNPTKPAMPKLIAADNTNASMTSSLFLPRNKALTKQ
jgi:hypothetical protein